MSKNKNITEFSFKKVYCQEVTPERLKTLKNEIEKIEGTENKILFLENEKINYLQNISPSIFEVSGSINLPNLKGEPLFFDKMIQLEIDRLKISQPPKKQTNTKTEQEQPKTFAELFYNPKHAEPCLKILNELQPPVIDAINNYIGKAKGVFPLWVKVLKNHKPEPLIKHFKDIVYKDLLNQKVNGLNLSKDASEFRKKYKRVKNDNIELDIKAILSQYSQSGKLGN